MLTQQDINKLKKIFATKEDLKKFATKEDLKKFATKEDLKKFATKEDLAGIVDELLELLMPHFNKMDELIDEIRSHRVVLGDHEKRIEKLKEKVYPTTS